MNKYKYHFKIIFSNQIQGVFCRFFTIICPTLKTEDKTEAFL